MDCGPWAADHDLLRLLDDAVHVAELLPYDNEVQEFTRLVALAIPYSE